MTTWTRDELDKIGESEELQISPQCGATAYKKAGDDLGRPRR